MTRVKICGITTQEGFDATVDAGADWLGLNFFNASPRYVTAVQAADLVRRAARGPLLVGLFVAPSDDEVAAVLDVLALDVLQLYVPPARAIELRQRFGVPVWRPVGVSTALDLPADAAGADGLLIEAKPPPGSTRPGGNAVSIDWSVLDGWTAPLPWLLAGGLTPDNVAEAIRVSGAPAVDVSSGVERERGIKDPALVRAFVSAARGG